MPGRLTSYSSPRPFDEEAVGQFASVFVIVQLLLIGSAGFRLFARRKCAHVIVFTGKGIVTAQDPEIVVTFAQTAIGALMSGCAV